MNSARAVVREVSAGLPLCGRCSGEAAAVVVVIGKHTARVCITCALQVEREKKGSGK